MIPFSSSDKYLSSQCVHKLYSESSTINDYKKGWSYSWIFLHTKNKWCASKILHKHIRFAIILHRWRWELWIQMCFCFLLIIFKNVLPKDKYIGSFVILHCIFFFLKIHVHNDVAFLVLLLRSFHLWTTLGKKELLNFF